ncbi:hypothetical protein AC1031_017202 [Aphanomyces cochlioides]|nr:hypothetical protein AC1031_017202 [Aphanomyces cochlioides]
MSASEEHAFLVDANLLHEENEENTDRPTNDMCDQDDDMSAPEEHAFLIRVHEERVLFRWAHIVVLIKQVVRWTVFGVCFNFFVE